MTMIATRPEDRRRNAKGQPCAVPSFLQAEVLSNAVSFCEKHFAPEKERAERK